MRKGLSDSLTMMIVILASVILAITVISILFGYLGYFGSSYGEVRQIGTALITQDGKLNITLENSFSNAKIVGIIYSTTLHNIDYTLSIGQHNILLTLDLPFLMGYKQ